MNTEATLRAISGLSLMVGLLFGADVFGAPESTTAASPFTLGSPTAATITSYSPLIGDNGAYPSTTATIYNLFGASNSSVEDNGDIIFGDRNSQPNTVDFTTPVPVRLVGLVVYLDSDDGTLDGPRSVGTITFSADGTQVLDAAPVNESIAVNGGRNIFKFANAVTASSFVVTFSSNPNLNFTPDANNDGVGPRILELDGIAPEPTSLGVLAIGVLGLLARPGRMGARSRYLEPPRASLDGLFCASVADSF